MRITIRIAPKTPRRAISQAILEEVLAAVMKRMKGT